MFENVKNNTNELHKLMHKFDPKDGDISFYLVIFERQARRANVVKEDWVSYLLGLLPYEITQLIARESEEVANDYEYIKELLLKRFKLSAEKFRQKFVFHQRTPKSTWKDFVFELRNYFEEWIGGLKITEFNELKELIVTDQLKRKVSNDIKNHFIDDWTKFINANELADRLDEYEIVRVNTKTFHGEQRAGKYGEKGKMNAFQNGFVNSRSVQNFESIKNDFPYNSRRGVNGIRNEKGEPKCYNCSDYGHISKDCPKPKNIVCRRCGISGHLQRNCVSKIEDRNQSNNNLSVSHDAIEPMTYLKKATINNRQLNALIDTGSSCCLLKESVARNLKLELDPVINELYGFGNQTTPAAQTIGKTMADIEIDNVIGENIIIYVVRDDAQPTDILIGRTWIDLPHIAFARVGNYLHIGNIEEKQFSNFLPEVNKTRIRLSALQTTKVEKNTVNLIKVKTDCVVNGLMLIQDPSENVGCLLEAVHGETYVPVANVGNKDIIFQENQCLGRAEEVEIYCNENSVLERFGKCEELECGEKDDEFRKTVYSVHNTAERRPIILEDIKMDTSIETENKLELLKLLNDYRDCFALCLNELGCTDLISMDIKEVNGAKPICSRPYKTNASERAAIKEIVKEWRDNGIVSDTRSPYASPVLLVRKKTGELRLVVDYRRLNSQTVKDKFPLPRIDDLLECLDGNKMFTTLDLAHGYLQIPLTEEAKLKTAFITPDDTGQFERMIFGLANAPAEFQRLMHQVLGPLLNTKVLCYLDDILIPAKSWKDMIEKLKEVFERLRGAKLTLKLPKCEFGKKEIEYLGFVLKTNGLQPGPKKVRAIEDFPVPKNVHDVRRFLGLTGFFRRFVPKYAEKAEPLTRLTRKGENFEWLDEQQKSFDTLKKYLVNQPTLAMYCPNSKTEVHTDASAAGLAGMILQKGEDDKWHLVYCVSKKTTEAEQKYHSSKLELMAIVWTLDRLRQFLIGIEFTIVTDCQALVYMNAKKSSNPQIARWSNLIQEYNFDVKHRPGTKMSHIDALSRAPTSEPKDTLDTIIENHLEVCLTLTVEEQMLMIQHADPKLKRMIDILKKEKKTKDEKQVVENYVLKGNRLFRITKKNDQEKLLYVIPKSMRKSIVVKFHDCMGHFAVDRTLNKIQELYWFPAMKRYVRQHISMCFECLVNKTPGGKQQGLLHPIKPGKRPFSIIHLDHLGPFVRSSKRNRELLVIIDNLTRFVRLYPMKDTSAKNVLNALKDFINNFGLPERIISDRGSCFTSHLFEAFCKENGISHSLNSTKHPQANGMVERVNRTILPVITTCMKDVEHKDWDLRMKEVERNLNNVVNHTTDKTPFEMLHGYIPRFNDGMIRRLADEDVKQWQNPESLQNEVTKKIEDKQEKMKKSYDRKRSSIVSFDKGEVVVVRRSAKSTGEPTKTQPKYRGPLVITEVLPNDTYRISQLEEKEKGKFYSTTAHVSQLKAWKCETDSDDDENEASSDDTIEEEAHTRKYPKRSVRKPSWYCN